MYLSAILTFMSLFVNESLIKEHSIQSSFLNERRTIKIEVPESYYQSNEKKYSVLYVLDGQNHHQNSAYISGFLADKKQIPELIIVSIPHTGKRSRDYYSFIEKTGALNKGSDNFLNFLESEVITYIEKNYRTTKHRLLSGHSSAGIFVLNSLIKRPGLFQSNFAFSPGLHHNKKLLDLTQQHLRSHSNLGGFIYFNLGGQEFYKSQNVLSQLEQIFKDYAPKKLRYNFERPIDDSHRTSPFIGIYLGLKRLYSPLKLSIEKNTIEDFKTHYSLLSKEFNTETKPELDFLLGQFDYYVSREFNLKIASRALEIASHFYPDSTSIKGTSELLKLYITSGTQGFESHFTANSTNKPEERFLNSAGYLFIQKKRYPDAIGFFKLAAILYPESANAHDSLGDGYAQNGDMTKAKRSYQKAIRIAQKSNDPDLELFKSKLKIK